MKFWEAMKALDEGKMVRAECFCENQALEIFEGEVGYKEGSGSCNIFSVFNEEWEIYEEPKSCLTFGEVVAGLKEGKKFRRPSWDNFEEIGLYGKSILRGTLRDYCPIVEDFEANDWEQVK